MLDKKTIKLLLSNILGEQFDKWYTSDQLQDSNVEISDAETKVCDMDQISKTLFHMLWIRNDSIGGAEENLRSVNKDDAEWQSKASRYERINAERQLLESLLLFHMRRQAVQARVQLSEVIDGQIVDKRLHVRHGYIIVIENMKKS